MSTAQQRWYVASLAVTMWTSESRNFQTSIRPCFCVLHPGSDLNSILLIPRKPGAKPMTYKIA